MTAGQSSPKVDLKRELALYRAPRGRCEVVTVPRLQFLMIDGQGDPNTAPAYVLAVSAIFPLAYGLKFLSKGELERDYVVMPLEGLWWAQELDSFTLARDKTQWHWTLMNLVPDWICEQHLDAVRDRLQRQGSGPALEAVRLAWYHEGLSVQTLHLGRYDDEGPVLERMHQQDIRGAGLVPNGHHHEIYLNDARRTAPQRLRTILRQPVALEPEGRAEPAGQAGD